MKKVISVILSILIITALFSINFSARADGVGTDYYVDSVSGSDDNDGTSAATAWATLKKVNSTTFAPGDRILFKRGCEFKGTLYPRGNGTEENPITISDYGNKKEAKPYIHCTTTNYSSAYADAAVFLYNQSHWVIENLEVANTNPSTSEKACIFVAAGENKTVYNITIQNNDVHGDSTDWSGSSHKGLDGIMVTTKEWSGNHDGIKIIGNTVKDCKDDGITALGSRCGGNINGVAASNSTHNVYIAENYLSNVGGDGILVNNCNEPVVEYNIAHKTHSYDKSYCCAMWAYSCRNALFQYNESYLTQSGGDAQGYDCDYMCTGTTFQYNYSHENAGGFMLICTEATTWDGKTSYNIGSVVRYNISQNDKGQTFSFVGHIDDTWIYNNTIFNTWATTSTILKFSQKGGPYASDTNIINNIFCCDTGDITFDNGIRTTFSNNITYGRVAGKFPKEGNENLTVENNIYQTNPKLYNPGFAKEGLDECIAYRIKEDSPAINAGVYIENPSVHPCKTDFFGVSIENDTNPNIGADNSTGLPADNTFPLYSGGYQSIANWETAIVGKTDTAIEPLSANTSKWSSVTEAINNIKDGVNLSGLEGSKKSLKITGKYSGNHVVELTLLPGTLANIKKIRIWMRSGSGNKGTKINMVGSGFDYCHSTSISNEGKWYEIDFEKSKFYGEKDGKESSVDRTLMPSSTAIKIRISLGTDEVAYIDDIQAYIGGIDTDYNITVGDNLLCGVAPETDYEDFVTHITKSDNSNFELLSGDSKITEGLIGTGMVLKVTTGMGLGKYSIVIEGDVSGDGKISSADLLKLKQVALGIDEFDAIFMQAGDVFKNDKINSADCLKLKRMILK